jgi:hypothetical protein
MATGKEIEGLNPPPKPFELWHVSSTKEKIKLIESADTKEELLRIKHQLDRRYEIYHQGKPIGFK